MTFDLSLNSRWAILFGLWLLLLTGVFSSFLGSPGILQAFRLQSLLAVKTSQLARVVEELQKLQNESVLLETSRVAQEREIRRVLGYTASDEIIFDFSRNDP